MLMSACYHWSQANVHIFKVWLCPLIFTVTQPNVLFLPEDWRCPCEVTSRTFHALSVSVIRFSIKVALGVLRGFCFHHISLPAMRGCWSHQISSSVLVCKCILMPPGQICLHIQQLLVSSRLQLSTTNSSDFLGLF